MLNVDMLQLCNHIVVGGLVAIPIIVTLPSVLDRIVPSGKRCQSAIKGYRGPVDRGWRLDICWFCRGYGESTVRDMITGKLVTSRCPTCNNTGWIR